MGPLGWFDESPDDSRGVFICLYTIQIFIADRQTGQPGVVQEVLADLKRKVPKQNMQVCTDDKDK